MTNPEEQENGNLISTFLRGGLPQLLAGSAGAAISRLVGNLTDIPSAYIESVSQRIRDKTEARSHVSKTISQVVAENAGKDPNTIERAMATMVDRAYRSQVNKDAVAAVAIKELAESPPSDTTPRVSDDWLTRFERYAEDASSDDLRVMFGKLLAGEIRKPGEISPSTLHFASMLDVQAARLIDRVLPVCTNNGLALLECLNPELSDPEVTLIEQSGFWTSGKTVTIQHAEKEGGIVIWPVGNDGQGVAMQVDGETSILFETAMLSKAGEDLAKVAARPLDFHAFGALAKRKMKITKLYYGKVIIDSDSIIIEDEQELHFPD